MAFSFWVKSNLHPFIKYRDEVSIKDVYSIHDITISIYTNELSISKVLRKFLSYFYVTSEKSSSDISFFFLSEKGSFLPQRFFPERKLLFQGDSVKYFLNQQDKILTLEAKDKAIAFLALEEPFALVLVREELLASSYLITHTLFYPLFQEALKRFGFFHVHAACVAHRNLGILITGKSGSGKSTLALSLLKEGFDFLSDDTTLVKEGKEKTMFFAFSKEIKLNPDTLDYFPELKFVEDPKSNDEKGKVSLPISEIYPQRVIESCFPKVIIFPRIKEGKSFLTPLSRPQALAKIVCYSLIIFDKEMSREHLRVLRSLVETCYCFDLEIGRNRENIPSLLRNISFQIEV